MSELAVPTQLIDVRTGEAIEPTAANAAELLVAAREFRNRLLGLVHDCEAVLLEESRRQGTKTLHLPAGTATVAGGPASELLWDVEELGRLLAYGLPQERYEALVEEIVSYKVNAAVAKQLEGSNADYAEVIAAARSRIDKPWRVSVR